MGLDNGYESECNPKYLIIDTEVAGDKRALVHLGVEQVTPQRNAVSDEFPYSHDVLSGKPSVAGLEAIVGAYGFHLERFSDWAGLTRDDPESAEEFKNYLCGYRVTARCKATNWLSTCPRRSEVRSRTLLIANPFTAVGQPGPPGEDS